MTTKLQVAKPLSEPKRCAAENLTPGQFLAPGALATGRPTEVLFTDTYGLDGTGRETLVVHRPVGIPYAVTSVVPGNHWFDLAAEEQLAEFRAGAERAQKIADIRALADYLEVNTWLPMPREGTFYNYVDGVPRDDHGPEGMAEMRRIAEVWRVKLNEYATNFTKVALQFGEVTYELRCFHKGGRPAEPAPTADPLGLAYTRADDEPDDPTPVSPARVPMHNGGMTDDGLVDETPAEPVACPPWCGVDGPKCASPVHAAEPVAEHEISTAWKGDEPGECGVECKCGVTYDGFDSLAEAETHLLRHIANPEPEPVDATPGLLHFHAVAADRTMCGRSVSLLPPGTGYTSGLAEVTCPGCREALTAPGLIGGDTADEQRAIDPDSSTDGGLVDETEDIDGGCGECGGAVKLVDGWLYHVNERGERLLVESHGAWVEA